MVKQRNPVIQRNIDEFFDLIRTRKTNTKDIKDLKFDYGNIIPLFVYDGLMRGHDDDHVLQECMYFGHATTQDDDWILMIKGYDRFGMFSQTNNILKYDYNLAVNQFKRIQGDLFGVPLDVLCYLDAKLENGSLYHRTDIPVMLHPYERSISPVKHAQVYIANYSKWAPPKGMAHTALMRPGSVISSKHLHERVYHAYEKVKTIMPVKEIATTSGSAYNSALWEDLQDDWP